MTRSCKNSCFFAYASLIIWIHSTERGPPTVGRTAARPGNVIRAAKNICFCGSTLSLYAVTHKVIHISLL